MVRMVFWRDMVVSPCGHRAGQIPQHPGMGGRLAVHIRDLGDGGDDLGLLWHFQFCRHVSIGIRLLGFTAGQTFLGALRDGRAVAEGGDGFGLGLRVVVGWSGLRGGLGRGGHGGGSGGGEFVGADGETAVFGFGGGHGTGEGLAVWAKAVGGVQACLWRGSTEHRVSIVGWICTEAMMRRRGEGIDEVE